MLGEVQVNGAAAVQALERAGATHDHVVESVRQSGEARLRWAGQRECDGTARSGEGQRANGRAAREHPDSKPTEITQDEANAYFAEGGVKMPKGVSVPSGLKS